MEGTRAAGRRGLNVAAAAPRGGASESRFGGGWLLRVPSSRAGLGRVEEDQEFRSVTNSARGWWQRLGGGPKHDSDPCASELSRAAAVRQGRHAARWVGGRRIGGGPAGRPKASPAGGTERVKIERRRRGADADRSVEGDEGVRYIRYCRGRW